MGRCNIDTQQRGFTRSPKPKAQSPQWMARMLAYRDQFETQSPSALLCIVKTVALTIMPHDHEPEIPIALDSVVSRLGELEIVLGPHVAPTVSAVRAVLTSALAARDRGDVPGAIQQISHAMDRLAALADQLDPAEALLMRALVNRFRTALLRGDEDQIKQSTTTMFHKSGAVERKKV